MVCPSYLPEPRPPVSSTPDCSPACPSRFLGHHLRLGAVHQGVWPAPCPSHYHPGPWPCSIKSAICLSTAPISPEPPPCPPQAITYAWELSTKVFGLPAERVWVSVYEQDEEAFAIWRDEIGVPAERIKRMGAADNFWASGPTGPCGPCSELYFDFHPERGTADSVSLEDDSRFIEFYNLVGGQRLGG